nr:PREDICTED: probable G-protein coupled receptor 88 [Opisthocomus hoazin]
MPNASSWTATSPLLLLWEDSSGTRIFLSLLYAVLAISGTLSNVMVIYLVFSFKKLQTTSNAFIVNGCTADLSVCALWMPQEAVLGLLPPNSSSLRSVEYQLLRGGLLGLGLTVSLASHLLVAFNRYVLITKLPSVYQALYQRRHTGCMIGLSWALALLLAPLLPGLWTLGSAQQPPLWHTDSSSRYTALLLALAVLGQTALLLHCYLGIVRRVRGSAKRVSHLRQLFEVSSPNTSFVHEELASVSLRTHTNPPGAASYPCPPSRLPDVCAPCKTIVSLPLANFWMMLSVETVKKKNRYTFVVIWFGYFVLKALHIRPVLTKASACGYASFKVKALAVAAQLSGPVSSDIIQQGENLGQKTTEVEHFSGAELLEERHEHPVVVPDTLHWVKALHPSCFRKASETLCLPGQVVALRTASSSLAGAASGAPPGGQSPAPGCPVCFLYPVAAVTNVRTDARNEPSCANDFVCVNDCCFYIPVNATVKEVVLSKCQEHFF